MIKIGQPVPSLACEAYFPDGRIEPISLAALRGRWVVLWFWPLDFTFACTAAVRAYAELSHDFDVSGAVLLGARVDSAPAHRIWVKHGLGMVNFPMLGDVSRDLVQAFGVLTESGAALYATFIIDPESRIVSVVANDPPVGRTARETLHFLHALQSSERVARDLLPCLCPSTRI